MGAVINPKIQSELQVTLIATGFGGSEVRKPAVKVSDVFAKLDTSSAPPPAPEPPRPRLPNAIDHQDLDMPAFLRRKRVE